MNKLEAWTAQGRYTESIHIMATKSKEPEFLVQSTDISLCLCSQAQIKDHIPIKLVSLYPLTPLLKLVTVEDIQN